jgi:hypothetical protein
MRTSFNHQPEAQHQNLRLFTNRPADYPISAVAIGGIADIVERRRPTTKKAEIAPPFFFTGGTSDGNANRRGLPKMSGELKQRPWLP